MPKPTQLPQPLFLIGTVGEPDWPEPSPPVPLTLPQMIFIVILNLCRTAWALHIYHHSLGGWKYYFHVFIAIWNFCQAWISWISTKNSSRISGIFARCSVSFPHLSPLLPSPDLLSRLLCIDSNLQLQAKIFLHYPSHNAPPYSQTTFLVSSQ